MTTKCIAKLPVGLRRAKLYADRVEHGGRSMSIRGAKARLDSRGFRGQKTYVVIEGPDIAFAQKMGSNSGLARKQAERFVAQVNSAAARLN